MTQATPIKEGRLDVRAGQAVVWNTIFAPLKFLAELISTVIQLNLLPKPVVGVLALIRATVNLIGNVIDLGIERALPKFIPEVQRSGGVAGVRRLLLRTMQVKAAVLVVVTAVIWWFRDRFLAYLSQQVQSNPDTHSRATLLQQIQHNGAFMIGCILLLLILGAFFDVLMAYLISYFHQRAWNTISLVNAVVQPLLIAGVILLGWSVTGVLLAMVVTPVVGVALAGWQVTRQFRVGQTAAPASEMKQDAPGLLRRFVPYSSLSYLLNVSDMAASQLIGVFAAGGLEKSALVWAAFSFVRGILAYLYTPLGGIQVPLFTHARADESTFQGAYAVVSRLLLLLLVPGGVGLALLAQPLVIAQYPNYVPAIPTILVLIPSLFLESILSASHNALMVSERYRPIVVSRLCSFALLPLLWLLAPRYGSVGIALGIGIARVGAGLVVFVEGRRLLGLRFPWRFAGRLGLAVGGMAALVFPLRLLLPSIVGHSIVARLTLATEAMVIAVLGAGAFLVLLRLSGGLELEDRRLLQTVRMPLKRYLLKLV